MNQVWKLMKKTYFNFDCVVIDELSSFKSHQSKRFVEVEMDEKEQQMYDGLKADLILPLEGGDIDAQSAVGLFNKLHQMANGAVYDENGNVRKIHDRKLDAVEDLIEAANENPVMIAYWFKHDRERLIERFGAGKCGVSYPFAAPPFRKE